MSGRLDLAGRTAVVTGAGGGIGRAIARSLAARDCHLALADINEAGLAETALMIGDEVRVSRHRLDVADARAVAALPGAVLEAHDGVDVLVNNAGVAINGTFEQVTAVQFDWLMSINFSGVVRMTRAFLPLLRQRDRAQLVNLSSLFGLVAPPGQTAYSAAKFAVRGFSEALRHELEAEKSGVGVTTVHPGGVRTDIARNAQAGGGVSDQRHAAVQKEFQKFLKLSPERAAEIIVTALERRRPRVLVGGDARFISLVERIFPVSYWSLVGRT